MPSYWKLAICMVRLTIEIHLQVISNHADYKISNDKVEDSYKKQKTL